MSDKNEGENVDSEEEDYEIYFLQPASSPYNMKEKLEAANKALFDENPVLENRQLTVKFKEELVDYEPDLTDDDVQSIESYNEVDYLLEQELIKETMPLEPAHKIELNIFTPKLNITEEEDELNDTTDSEHGDQTEENIEGVINDTNSSENEKSDESFIDKNSDIEYEIDEQIESNSYGNNCSDQVVEISNTSSSISNGIISDYEIEDVLHSDDIDSKSKSSTNTSKSSTPSKKNPVIHEQNLLRVDCRSHCIERLDSQLDLMVSKLQLNERPMCPTLKLIKRKCCEENLTKNELKLPRYSGLRSEYGLSLQQLEKRQKRKELLHTREEKRNRLMEEFKNRKIQQNEVIFAQWLKNLQKRKEDVTKRKGRKLTTAKNLDSSSKSLQKLMRPRTCYPVISNNNIKKQNRPKTSPACVFIEVPRAVLKKGLHIGNIIVTSSRNVPSKESAHVLSIS